MLRDLLTRFVQAEQKRIREDLEAARYPERPIIPMSEWLATHQPEEETDGSE